VGKVTKAFEADVLPELLKALRKQTQVLEATLDVLQEGQALVPPPTMKEFGEMREGKRPLSREAFLLGAYQRLIIGAENLISDLRTVTHRTTLKRVHTLELSGNDFNAIQEAIQELAGRAPSRGRPRDRQNTYTHEWLQQRPNYPKISALFSP
jgi:hypothetical protein